MTGIPTARNVDHIAYTVPDLKAAIEFFAGVLGAQLLYRQGPVADPDGDFMLRQLGVHPRAVCHVALMRFGPVTNLELFEYRAPGQRRRLPLISEPGGHHIAISVSELDTAIRYLADQPGVTIHNGPNPAWPGRRVYFDTPWGMRLELVEHEPDRDPGGRYVPAGPWPGGATGIPTARGVDHVGYTVPDLDQAIAFFTGPLGGELTGRAGRGVSAAARPAGAMVRLGPVTNVELQCFGTGGAGIALPRNSDVGGHHLAFFVDDVDLAAAALRETEGAEVMGEPQTVREGGPIDGDRWVYFRGPWGFQFEVLNLPPSLPYERSTAARRYGPAPSWHGDTERN